MDEDIVLDEFGLRLITQVRNKVVQSWRMILEGKMKGERADEIRKLVAGMEAELVSQLVPEITDSVLHHLLTWFEEDDEFKISTQKVSDIANESDGLAGELYSDAGWIAKFSKM